MWSSPVCLYISGNGVSHETVQTVYCQFVRLMTMFLFPLMGEKTP